MIWLLGCALLGLDVGGPGDLDTGVHDGDPDNDPDNDSAAQDSAGDSGSGAENGAENGANDPFCDEAPVVTWANFGHGFLVESCNACHAASAPDRHGAPAGVTFDTEAEVAAWVEPILATATGKAPAMPPAGGVTEDERYLLEAWLRCFPPS